MKISILAISTAVPSFSYSQDEITHTIIRIIINDLHRHWFPYIGFALIAKPFFPNRLIFHDGLLSIRRAFKKKDWINYLQAANIPLEYCSITWHWGFRWVINIDTSFKLQK